MHQNNNQKSTKNMVISAKKLCVTKSNQLILKNIDIDIFCGEMLGIIGPNGGGKSTFIKTLLGQNEYKGKVSFFDDAQKAIGYVPQVMDYDKLSPISVLDFFCASLSKRPVFLGASKAMRARVLRCLESVEATAIIDRPLGALSGGELQRVLLALSLEPIPKILLLDEPVSGVDQSGLDNFYKLVEHMRQKHNLAVVIVSHDLRFIQKYATKVALIDVELREYGNCADVFASSAFRKEFGLRQN